MAADHPELAELVRDARLVVDYAARVGRLPDTALAVSAGKVEATLTKGGPSPEVYASFLAELNHTVRAIAPISLIELGSSWRPYPNTKEYAWFNRCLVLIAVALIATVAFYTQIFTLASETLGAMHDMRLSEAEEKLDQLGVFMQLHPSLTPQFARTAVAALHAARPGNDPPDAGGEDSQMRLAELLKELRAINQRKSEVEAAIFDINRTDALYPPWVAATLRTVIAALGALRGDIGGTLLTPAAASPPGQKPPLLSQEDYIQSMIQSTQDHAGGNDPGKLADTGICPPALAGPDPACVFSLTALVGLPAQVQAESAFVEYCRQLVFILGNWILPALYGLIGAIVFQMRRILSPLQPNLPPIRLLFRIALGGFAGVIVTWFWSPSVGRIAVGDAISITAFGAAFIVGYSSEIFFVLLDTSVEQVLGMIRGGLKSAG
jgi:hypothetical protein